MWNHLSLFLSLLWGSVIYRPYVYVFFICFLFFSLRHLKFRGTASYLVFSYGIAYLCEYSSTRNGFPFGIYIYLDETRTRELWISNIPFWDSLSFVFLSYFSWILASFLKSPKNPSRGLLYTQTALLGGLLMMLLDVVIDPLTVLGDRWFLGQIYYYPQGGTYFGVTLSNFVGWFFVGTVTLLFFQFIAKKNYVDPSKWQSLSRSFAWKALGVYSGIFIFNWVVTAWIHEWTLLKVSSVVILSTLLPILWVLSSA